MTWRLNPIIGRVFGKLTVVRYQPNSGGGLHWLCKCVCGVKIPVENGSLRRGEIKSCGCTPRSRRGPKPKHPMVHSVEYHTWKGMLSRCRDTKNKSYGGRGIEVRFKDFDEFYAEVGPRPWDGKTSYSIHRINNDGHYEKGNVAWVTPDVQCAPGNKRYPKPPSRTHCRHGHEMTPENTYVSKQGFRTCKECMRLHSAKYNAENRLHTAAWRLTQRLDGEPLVFLHGLPPLIPHDCMPIRWPANNETAVALTEKVFEIQMRPVHTVREWFPLEWARVMKDYKKQRRSHKNRPDPCHESARL